MSRTQKIVVAFAVMLLLAWGALNLGRLTRDADGVPSTERIVCLVLGSLFFLAILFRPAQASTEESSSDRSWTTPSAGVAGLIAALAGIIFDSQQLNWLGLLLLFYACLQWSLPPRFSGNILTAMIPLYLVHPLPFSVVGPLQLAMQYVSVQGAEWLAHCFNIGAWADGTVLRTETIVIDVPQACSGMTTAIVVLASCLGTGLLFRIRWYQLAILIFIGLAQVLALNILRIGLIAVVAPKMPPEWAFSYVHDSLGVLLIAGIVLIQLEAALWLNHRAKRQTRKREITTGVTEPVDTSSSLHPFWRYFSRYLWVFIAAVVIAAGTAAAIYKRRPYHRSRMIHRLVDNVALQNLADAERIALAAVRMDMDNIPARYSLAQVLAYRKKCDQAIAELDKIPGKNQGVASTVIRAQALAGKKQFKEALVLIDNLPEPEKKLPPVAITRAEMAAEQNDVRCVASNIVMAAVVPSTALLRRVRALFPFLAANEEWKAIVACDQPLPYIDPVHAAIAIEAYLRLNDMNGMTRTLRRAVKTWPDNPMFLTYLLAAALRRPEAEWEDLFARNLLRNLQNLDSDRLAACLQHCFQLRRPDLAWLTYRQLSAIDPKDPTLYLTASQFADEWFTFRMKHLGLSSTTPEGITNLKPLYKHTSDTWPFSLIWNNIPLAGELGVEQTSGIARTYLQSCIEELERREKKNGLNLRTEMMLVTALTKAGKLSEVGQRLDKLGRLHPERELELLPKRLMLTDLQRDWHSSYEVSWRYNALTRYPDVHVSFSQINALIQLRLGMHALVVAERLRNLFPSSPQTAMALAATLETCGFHEESLFLMSKMPETTGSPTWTAALYGTERFLEADRFATSTDKPNLQRPERSQKLFLAPAELAIVPPCPGTEPTAEDMDRILSQFERTSASASGASTSPYINGLKRLTTAWCTARDLPANSDPAKWEAIGRDETERALALHKLATLLILNRRADDAEKALARATALVPDASVLWQARVAASGGRKDVVKQAQSACPSSPELWLAGLVAKTRDSGRGDWAVSDIKQVTDQQKYSVGTIVRAGDFLLRAGMTNAAVSAARYCVKNANGLLPAYVLGLRCALAVDDRNWAISCASQAARNALDPTAFEIALVSIQMKKGRTTAELVGILNKLRNKFPTDPQWSERLGNLYFQKGDMRAASSVFTSLAERKLTDRLRANSLLVAAEAYRLEGRNDEALAILSNAYDRDGDNVDILNNFIYVLAQEPKTLGKARALLPKLLSRGQQSSSILDTAAFVHMKAGNLTQASDFAKKALSLVRPEDYAADELHLNAAEIYLLQGEYVEARKELKLSRQSSQQPLLVENRRLRLMLAVEKKIQEKTGRRQEP